MGLILDTSVLIAGERKRLDLPALFAAHPGELFFITTITAAELLDGVARAGRPARKKGRGEYVEDVLALRDLGLRYGQGYYMARPGPPFPTLPDYVRAELRSITPGTTPSSTAPIASDPDDDDDENLAIPVAPPKPIVRNVFGRAEDEITSDFALPGTEGRRPRASEQIPTETVAQPSAAPVQVWQPLSDDEATGEALLSSLKRAENAPDGEPGPGRPGLN